MIMQSRTGGKTFSPRLARTRSRTSGPAPCTPGPAPPGSRTPGPGERGQLPCLRDRNRLRRDSRVTVSRTATASAISPATWPVSPGWTKAMAEEPGTGLR